MMTPDNKPIRQNMEYRQLETASGMFYTMQGGGYWGLTSDNADPDEDIALEERLALQHLSRALDAFKKILKQKSSIPLSIASAFLSGLGRAQLCIGTARYNSILLTESVMESAPSTDAHRGTDLLAHKNRLAQSRALTNYPPNLQAIAEALFDAWEHLVCLVRDNRAYPISADFIIGMEQCLDSLDQLSLLSRQSPPSSVGAKS